MRKVFVMVLAVVLLVGITGFAYGKGAGKGPAEKATGGVRTTHANEWHVSFNAHEGPAATFPDGKGQVQMSSSLYGGGVGRSIYLVVKYVNVDPIAKAAWFAAECTSDDANILVGKYLLFKVTDGGSPGAGNDTLGWIGAALSAGAAKTAVSTPTDPTTMFNITKGNLVVH